MAWLLAGTAERVSAQKAGFWEEQDSVDGMPVGVPIRACRIAGAHAVALQAWPANCVAKPLQRTATGMVSEARCATGRAGMSLSLRRELIGNLDRSYRITTSSRIVGAATGQAPHRSTVTLRYLGRCPGSGNRPAGSDPVALPAPSREPPPANSAQLLVPIVLVFSTGAAVSWRIRRRWRDRLQRATVTNIVTDAAGAAAIPVLATFTGIRGLPWWYAIASNNAAPLLVLEPDGIRFRVLRRQQRHFSDIACVDLRQARGTMNLDFTFHDSIFTFAANVGTVALAAHVITLLPTNIPLSSRARAVRATT